LAGGAGPAPVGTACPRRHRLPPSTLLTRRAGPRSWLPGRPLTDVRRRVLKQVALRPPEHTARPGRPARPASRDPDRRVGIRPKNPTGSGR